MARLAASMRGASREQVWSAGAPGPTSQDLDHMADSAEWARTPAEVRLALQELRQVDRAQGSAER